MQQHSLPDYLFETSWEVCNKVGGIYTVIASKTPVLRPKLDERLLFIGPDVWKGEGENPDFTEDKQLYKAWREQALSEGLKIRIGYWNIPDRPIAILIDFTPLFSQKNDIFTDLWLNFQLDSIDGGWDYIEPALFGYAAGKVIESFAHFHATITPSIVAQFHEWMTGTGILYLRQNLPHVATVFTTHATVLGRCIAGNGMPLYESLSTYKAEQLARQFGVTAKQSLEKTSAHHADCFTTVSQLTAKECAQFLQKTVDLVTPNGFDDAFVPANAEALQQARNKARQKLLSVAEAVCHSPIDSDAYLVVTSGRYEFHNKGIDIFIDALHTLHQQNLERCLVAYIMVPAHHAGVRRSLLDHLQHGNAATTTDDNRILTHHLHNPEQDPVLQRLAKYGLYNAPDSRIKVIFVPSYLNGHDELFNVSYYDLLVGCDLSVFPSYYEPWGYTPLESLAFGVPTITTTLAGFGLWAKEKLAGLHSGLSVIERTDSNDATVVEQVAQQILKATLQSPQAEHYARQAAREISFIARWDNLIQYYYSAYHIALQQAAERQPTMGISMPMLQTINTYAEPLADEPKWKRVLITASLPPQLIPLQEMVQNLWWCWQPDAQRLLAAIKPEWWQKNDQNPIALLDALTVEDYQRLQHDNDFMTLLQNVYARFQQYMESPYAPNSPQIAYFCMEYGLHHTLKLYSGGLGILAGDYLKEASDSRCNMVAIGLLYRYGYFTQQISAKGEQIDHYEPQRFSHLPLHPVKDEQGNWVRISLPLPGRLLYAKIWQVPVGRINLYLLDTDISENSEEDRTITHRLYGGDWEMRLKQEILLGIGGVRLLKILQYKPDLFHLNEGHAAFSGLERLRLMVNEQSLQLDEALELVRGSSLFTTHTPVPAGHDAFSEDLLRAYLSNYSDELHLSWQDFMAMGKINQYDVSEKFSMSHLAIRTSQGINGVSRIHGAVSRDMFLPLWKGYTAQELHVGYVTNGVHYPTWVAPEWDALYRQTFGEAFLEDQSNTAFWQHIETVEDETLWQIRLQRKRLLLDHVRHLLQYELKKRQRSPRDIVNLTKSLQPESLIIGFARRFATYKRAQLLFSDPERLLQIVNDSDRPILFLFAGKAHPADKAGQQLIQQIVNLSEQPAWRGKVLFLENYDMQLARLLVQGVDVWLNTPTRPLEASGTSGMKAAMNGVLNFSVLDGWWAEAYTPQAGWALTQERTYPPQYQDYQNELDAQTIYNILENDLVPLYFQRDANQIPTAWLQKVKANIATVAPRFTTKRMLDDYRTRYYQPLFERIQWLRADSQVAALDLARWKRNVRRNWEQISVLSTQMLDTSNHALSLTDTFTATITLQIGELQSSDIAVTLLIIERTSETDFRIVLRQSLGVKESGDGIAVYQCTISPEVAGVFDYGFRISPQHPGLPYSEDFGLVRWV
ncbi:MAG: alpha-glucan family phosphorylase [Chitinophagales bacterium]|jgi:phosphorylase/glycogen(starch) synthase|nr:alpha-glucan family phosphorylase [Chitinophagales bacterium]